MSKRHLVAVIGLPLVLIGCSEDTVPPSAPRIEAPSRTSARVADTAVQRFRAQIRELGAFAEFSSVDQSGCVFTDVVVFASEQARKEGPGKATPGTLAAFQIFEFNSCTGEQLRFITGELSAASFQGDRKLAEASLQATIPAFDQVSNTEVEVVVDLAWTGVGVFVNVSSRFRQKSPLGMFSFWLKGTFRVAEVTGTVTVGGENLAMGDRFAELSRARNGVMELVRFGD